MQTLILLSVIIGHAERKNEKKQDMAWFGREKQKDNEEEG